MAIQIFANTRDRGHLTIVVGARVETREEEDARILLVQHPVMVLFEFSTLQKHEHEAVFSPRKSEKEFVCVYV